MKRLLSGILILLIFLAPLNTVMAATTAASAAAVAAQFNPNVNFTSGNTYNGVSISGIGGAIASCANIGGFLTSAASSLTSSLGGLVSKSASSYSGGGSAVSTSDSKTQDALATQNTTTQCLDGVAYAVAKNALAQITNKTLKWVNSGLNGNPLYVQNVSSYLGSIKTQQTNQFLSTVQSSDPIFGNALRSAITLGVTGRSDGLLNTPLNTPQAQSYASFQTDFTNGGWDALLNPAYNPIGAFFNAVDNLNGNVATQQQQATNEIQRNNGFLDMKQCTQYANNGAISGTNSQCSAINSDSIYETCCTGQADEDSAACNSYATADATAAGSPQCANITDDTVYNQCCNGDSGDSAMCVAYNTSGAADANNPDNISGQNGAGIRNNPVCTQWTTTTPGSVISSQVQTITNTPVQQLVYADKINEVLGSFFDSFINNLLSKGLRGSGGSITSVDGGYGSEGNNYVANNGAAGGADLGYQASGSGDADTGDFDISRPQQLRAMLQTQENFMNASLDAQTALERIVPAIGALDYCIPGPNPDWDNGLDSNWQSFTATIQQAPANSPSTLDNILGALPEIGGIITAIIGTNKAPPVWIGNAVLSDKATGNSIQLDRTFFNPSTSFAGRSQEVVSGLSAAYQQLLSGSQYGYFATTANSFNPSSTNSSAVGNAFVQAAANDSDPAYVHGFLQDAYTYTDSLINYNQSATAIDNTYSANLSAMQNTVEQMTDIRNQVDAIVSTAKAAYIAQNPGVNVQCLDQAYVIDESPVVPTPRIEPDANNPLEPEEDLMVQHSVQSASYFYSQIK